MKRIVTLITLISVLPGLDAMEQADRSAKAADIRAELERRRVQANGNQNQVTAAGQEEKTQAQPQVSNAAVMAQILAEMQALRQQNNQILAENNQIKQQMAQGQQAQAPAQQVPWAQQFKQVLDTSITNAINITHFVAGYSDLLTQFTALFDENANKTIDDLIREKQSEMDGLIARSLDETATPAAKEVLNLKIRTAQVELGDLTAQKLNNEQLQGNRTFNSQSK